LRSPFLAYAGVEYAPSFIPVNVSLPFYFEHNPLLFVLLFFHGFNFCWQATLSMQLVSLISVNLTTNEAINKQRYEYLRDPRSAQFYNPFDRGTFMENFKALMFPSEDWYRLYSIRR
jgi:hypothetical protein